MDRIVKIAVTGGIGSGKSLVIKYLSDLGYKVVSCDKITENLYRDHDVKAAVKNAFQNVVSGEKRLTLNKRKLSAEVFSDENKRRKLEVIIHPVVLKKALKLADKKGINFIEVPVLFERDYQKYFDGVIVVLRAEEERIKSVKLRSDITEDEVKKRIAAQTDYAKIDLTGYFIIDNGNTKEDLKRKVKTAVKEIEEKFL